MILRICTSLMFVVLIALSSTYSQWIHVQDTGGGTVNCLAVRDTILYAGTDKGLFISTNSSGTGWTTTPTNSRITSLLISGTNMIQGSVSRGISLYSADNGTTWNTCNTGAVGECFNSFVANGTILLGGTDGQGIFRSTDNGLNWKLTSPAVPYTVNCFAVVDADIFAGCNGGIYRSSDNGNNWTKLNTGIYSYNFSAIAAVGLHLYAGTSSGVMMSTNSGTSWSGFMTNGIPGNYWIGSLAVSGFTLFQGSQGVYSLNDGDTTWKSFGTGMITYVGVKSLLVCGRYLYALTYDYGLYRRPLSEMVTSVNGVAAGVLASFELSQNYPNPFNPSTTIRYALPKESFVSLKVFNLLGEDVATLVEGRRQAGAYTAQLDASKLVSGVYFYRLQAGEYVETKKLVVLK